MLSYQHPYHAGCLADVHKHFCLSALLAAMASTGQKIHYVETHAGRGIYNLNSPEAHKTGEAKLGIIPLLEKGMIAETHPYYQTIHVIRKLRGPNSYPGSPFIAKYFLSPKHRISLFELHPQEYAALLKNISAPFLTIHKQDGYTGALNLKLRSEQQNIVFIDPSYELKTEYTQAADFITKLHRKLPNCLIILWYPILTRKAHEAMLERIQTHFAENYWMQEISFPQSSIKRATGSGLIILNLPKPLHTTLDEVKALFA